MKRWCWWWRAKWALLKIWNSNQKSTFDWYCICTIKWNSYEFARRVHVSMCASVCVRYVSICMEINIVLHIQFLNFWFGFDNFSFRIFQLNAKPHTHSCNSSKEFRYLWNFMQFHELFWSIFVVKRIFPENSVCCAHEKEERNRW